MPREALPKIPSGSDVFLDANVLIYSLAKSSPECLALLQRCAAQEITGITSLHVLAEVTHRLMMKEAQNKGLAGPNPSRVLKERPETVKQLSGYWQEVERLLALNLLFVAVDQNTIRTAQEERTRYGLLTNDSLLVASMRSYGISILATRDADFERVASIFVYSPSDI